MKLASTILCIVLVAYVEPRDPRSAEELTNCVRIAEPLIHNPGYVFPLSVSEIRTVCGKWDHFVDCIRKYTTTFLSRSQQKEFDKAINPSMQSIHQLCIQDKEYEKEYLYYAPCMKKISIETPHCGDHYMFLAKVAESATETGPAICCGYHKFRSCVLEEAQRECDKNDNDPARPASGNNSSHFVSSMLQRALGFLNQKCSYYEPTSSDCLSYLTSGSKSDPNALKNFGIDGDTRSDRSRDARLSFGAPDEPLDENPPPAFPTNQNVNLNHLDDNGQPAQDWNQPNREIENRDQSDPGTESRFSVHEDNYGGSEPSSASSSSRRDPSITVYPPSSNRPPNSFTWTTVTPSFFPTRASSSHIYNGIRGPESQEFKGSESGASPVGVSYIGSMSKWSLHTALSLMIMFLDVLRNSYALNR